MPTKRRSTAPHLVEPQLKYLTDATFSEYHQAIARGFQEEPHAELKDLDREIFDKKRMFGFKVGRRWVATCGDFARRLTVPGGAAVPTAAVTIVTVQPPYRRRGLLRKMMVHQLEQVAKRGEPLAALWSSESLIYGRFGYGPASSRGVLTGTNRRLGFLPGVRTSGSVDEVTREEFLAVARGLHESMRPERPGTMVARRRRLGVRDLRQGVRARWRVGDALRRALRRGRRRRRVRDVPLQDQVRRGAGGRGAREGGLGRGGHRLREHLALPARPRPRAHLQAVELAARRAAAPPGHRRARGRDVRHRQPLPAHHRRRGGPARPEVRRRGGPRHRGRRPDPARQLGPLPDRHRRQPGPARAPR